MHQIITPDPKDELDDILYFERQLLKAFVDKNWDRVIKVARKLKLMNDALVVYRISHDKKMKGHKCPPIC